MSRCIFWFKDNENYVNVEADEFHEDDGYLKAYLHNELVAMFLIEIIKGAYRSDAKGGKDVG